MSLGITANREKNGALLAYIAVKVPGINLRKLLKLIYLIDEKFMLLRGFPLTWFDYYAWVKGPVAPEVYELKNGAFADFVACHKNEAGSNIVEAVSQGCMDLYSPYEMEVIEDVLGEYANYTADELSALTHEETSLWSRICKEENVQFVSGQSDVLIPLQLLNGADEEKNEIYEDARWNMGFQAALNQHNKEEDVPTA